MGDPEPAHLNGNLIVRRDAFWQAGGYDERIRSYAGTTTACMAVWRPGGWRERLSSPDGQPTCLTKTLPGHCTAVAGAISMWKPPRCGISCAKKKPGRGPGWPAAGMSMCSVARQGGAKCSSTRRMPLLDLRATFINGFNEEIKFLRCSDLRYKFCLKNI